MPPSRVTLGHLISLLKTTSFADSIMLQTKVLPNTKAIAAVQWHSMVLDGTTFAVAVSPELPQHLDFYMRKM